MAHEKKEAFTPEKPVPAEVAAPETPGGAPAGQVRMTYYVDYRKKKKRRASRGLRDLQDFERGATRSAERVARAVFRGLGRYDRLRDKSSRKKKDGAIRDGLDNWSRAMGRTLRVASRAPYDFTKEIGKKRLTRQLRDTVKIFVAPIFR